MNKRKVIEILELQIKCSENIIKEVEKDSYASDLRNTVRVLRHVIYLLSVTEKQHARNLVEWDQ